MKLKELKATDFKEDQKYNFIFPIGATEQHGSFIPFGTDTYITDYLVERVSGTFPEIVILPTLEYSRSQEHRGFYGTIWLSEETLEGVLSDVCNSTAPKARNIFLTSFHANDAVIQKFIKNSDLKNVVHLEIFNEADDDHIRNILDGPIDEHAGNSEISNMLFIDKDLVEIPPSDFPKSQMSDPWKTDNLVEKCPNGIADNHPKWVTNPKRGKAILDIYAQRMVKNLKSYF